MYALSALKKDACLNKGHDFCDLWLGEGGHPYLATITIVALPIIIVSALGYMGKPESEMRREEKQRDLESYGSYALSPWKVNTLG